MRVRFLLLSLTIFAVMASYPGRGSSACGNCPMDFQSVREDNFPAIFGVWTCGITADCFPATPDCYCEFGSTEGVLIGAAVQYSPSLGQTCHTYTINNCVHAQVQKANPNPPPPTLVTDHDSDCCPVGHCGPSTL